MENNENDLATLSKKLLTYLRKEFENPNLDYQSDLLRLEGGYETSTYRFQLSAARKEISKSLVLRLYPNFYGEKNALWESTIQNLLAEEGFPVARAHLVCSDLSILGGAFFIMDYLPGQLLIDESPETIPQLLGETHAALHKIDPGPLIKKLNQQGISENAYSLKSQTNWLNNRADKYPWIMDSVTWLIENQPQAPKQVSICHGDFHALNILVQNGNVTGVLDWPGFAIADPVFDVANTLVLTTIPAKHLSAGMEGLSSVDWNTAAAYYLSAYQKQRALDTTHLEYYRIRRSVLALLQGSEGQKVWQHPLIIKDLVDYIRKTTGIEISLPA
jgi:aminoglycoside phosphotransferase (APT) family kinase protein